MRKESLEDFDLPWCKLLQDDPAWTLLPGREPLTPMSNLMMRETLNTNSTIRAVQCFIDAEGNFAVLMSLGSGLTGNHHISHGGVIATIIDTVMGASAIGQISTNLGTATMTINYKKPVPIPSVVLCKSWSPRREGRKIWTKATLEGENGDLYATGEALFVIYKETL